MPSHSCTIRDPETGTCYCFRGRVEVTLRPDQCFVDVSAGFISISSQQQADDIRAQAQQYERDTRYAAEDYADQVFSHLEENLKNLTSTVSRCRQMLNEGAESGSNTLSW